MKAISFQFGRRQPSSWLLLLLLLIGLRPWAQAQTVTFGSLEEILAYADAQSATAKSAEVQTELAKLQKAAAIANTVNLKGNASLSMTDNYALPVNFLPAEIFGGPAGTFRQVTFGQQFVNLGSITPQLDLVSPSTWARVGSAKASAELTATSNALNRRNLHENIATAFCNYRSLEAQLLASTQNLANADSIAAIFERRYAAGLIRKQDWNNALVNQANLADFVVQLQLRQRQQLLSLQALLGLSPQAEISLRPDASPQAKPAPTGLATSTLLSRQADLQSIVQRSELRANRFAFLPTVSLVAGFNWQQNSNESVINSAEWIGSRYVGLRISMPLPTETRLWSQAEEYRINLKLKTINAAQVATQEKLQNAQLGLDIDRAAQSLQTAETVQRLKTENYASAMTNYEAGILAADQLFTAFTDMLNAQLNTASAIWNLELQFIRLSLNQSIQ